MSIFPTPFSVSSPPLCWCFSSLPPAAASPLSFAKPLGARRASSLPHHTCANWGLMRGICFPLRALLRRMASQLGLWLALPFPCLSALSRRRADVHPAPLWRRAGRYRCHVTEQLVLSAKRPGHLESLTWILCRESLVLHCVSWNKNTQMCPGCGVWNRNP